MSNQPEQRNLLKALLSGLLAMSPAACNSTSERALSGEDNRACMAQLNPLKETLGDEGYKNAMKSCMEERAKTPKEKLQEEGMQETKKVKKAEEVKKTSTTDKGEGKAATVAKTAETSKGQVIISSDAKPSESLITFANEIQNEGDIWVGTLPGIDDGNALIYVTSGYDPSNETERIVRIHGTYGENLNKKPEGNTDSETGKKWVGWNKTQQTLDAMDKLQEEEQGVNIVLIHPFSNGSRMEPGSSGRKRAYDRMFMKSVADDPRFNDNFDQTLRQATEIAEKELGVKHGTWSKDVIVQGDRSGGIGLRNIAQSGTKQVTEYIFLDASYVGWAKDTYEAAMKKNPDIKMSIVTRNTGRRDQPSSWCGNFEDDANFLEQSQAWCEENGEDAVPPGQNEKREKDERQCRTFEARAALWNGENSDGEAIDGKGMDYETWCLKIRANSSNIFTQDISIRDRISTHEFPGTFSGGLNLPADRYEY